MATRSDTVLVVGDPRIARDRFDRNGYRLHAVEDLEEALRLATELDVDVALVDARSTGPRTPAVVEALAVGGRAPEILVLTDSDNIGFAVQALRRGARCYLVTPCREGELELHVHRATDARRVRIRLTELEDPHREHAERDLSLETLEREHILRVLRQFEGNKREAAKALRISLKTLYNRLHRYGEM